MRGFLSIVRGSLPYPPAQASSRPCYNARMTSRELAQCLRVAIRAAQAGGAILRRRPRRAMAYTTKRHAIDLVTRFDRASEHAIRRMLLRAFPEHGMMGEERTRVRPEAPLQWIVDPLDGTTNFVHGVPAFAVSIGLADRGHPVLGVIYDPSQRELYTAVRGGGTRLNGRRVRVSRARRLADSLLSTGFSERFRRQPAPFVRWFTALQQRTHAVRRMGSTALSLAYVAAGRQDGFYEQDLWPWDIAAGIILVEEAGGRITDFAGRPVRLSGAARQYALVASNRLIHRPLLSHLD